MLNHCSTLRYLKILPYTHVQGVKQSVMSIIVVTKFARSRVLCICACCNYHELVDIGKKLVSDKVPKITGQGEH